MMKYHLMFDIKLVKKAMYLIFFIVIILNFTVFNNTEFIMAVGAGENYIQTSLYEYAEVFLPIFFPITVILLFSKDFNKGSLLFLKSLPFHYASMVILRFIRLFALFMLLYIPSLVNMCYTINRNLSTSVMIQSLDYTPDFFSPFSLCMQVIPQVFFLGSLALLSIVVLKKMYYSIILLAGYYMFEYFTNGVFTGKFMLFINHCSSFPDSIVMLNRMVFTLIGISCIVCVYFVIENQTGDGSLF